MYFESFCILLEKTHKLTPFNAFPKPVDYKSNYLAESLSIKN